MQWFESRWQMPEPVSSQIAYFGRLRKTVRGALKQRAGTLPDAITVAAAAAATWRLVQAQLVPVIGARGLAVLYRRALHQTAADFPWMVACVDGGALADPLPSLTTCLAAQAAVPATEAAGAMLVTFAELLAALIGESLTERLLAPVWARPSLPSDQEPHHE
jgi:hypothetical protein